MTSGQTHHPPQHLLAPLLVLLLASAVLGAAGGAQVFRERPNSVQVRAGSDVFLRCAVDNQQGKAQWTKDGFALGFERSVPGYPRYQYAGEGRLGEHHLIIKGITLEDDGEYQCQVGPTDTTLPIWASANVTVMVPPASVVVLGRSDGEVVEVVEGARVLVQCEVDDARPEPVVTWFRRDVRIDPKLQTDEVTASHERRLLKVVSRLEMKAKREDDGEEFKCQVTHPALQPPSRPLTASVSLSVLHPPGAPVIIGYRTGEVLRAGERRTLTCRVLGGNPSPWVTWYWHHYPSNHTKAGKSVYLKGKDAGDSRKTKKGRGVNVTQQLTATRSEDGAVYECRVSNDQLARPLSTNITLTVHYAPTQVKVSGPTVVAAGERFSLTCLTSPANPPASLNWIIDGKQVKNATTAVTKDDGGGWVTSSDLTYKAERSGQVREVRVRCEARHRESVGVISHSRNVTILRPPGMPVVEVDTRGRAVAGGSIGVTCTSKEGHPPPTLRMSKGKEEVKSETVTRNGVSKARATLELTPQDNGAKIECQATNPATSQPLTAYTNLKIQFAAWEVTGKVSPREVESGQVVKVSCDTSSSVPPSTITWGYLSPAPDASPLPQPSDRTIPGSYGGTITRSELRVRVRAEDNGRMLRCQGDNGLGVTVADNVTLRVLHAPVWDRVPVGVLNVPEGHNLTLPARALANPGPVRYSWRLDGREMAGDGDQSGAGLLRLSPLNRLDSGNYTVSAQSPRGVIVSAFTLNVQYGPEKIVTSGRVRVARNGSATVICTAAGNPTPNLTWTRQHTDNTSSKVRVLGTGMGEARMVVTRAARADTGIYLCHASSSLAAAPPVPATLVVDQAPWWVSERPGQAIPGSWASVGGTGRVECRMRAEPPPIFHWATEDGRAITTGGKYSISDPEPVDGVVEWTSVLEVRRVEHADYTHYICTATNTQGKHTYTLALTPPIPPAAPTHLVVTNVTLSQVELFWQPDLTRTQPSGYLLTYTRMSDGRDRMVNVTGSGRTRAVVGDLAAGTSYSFTLQAYNPQGLSLPSAPPVTALTQGVAERVSTDVDEGEGEGSRVPRLILLIMTLAGTALLALNMAIIACFVRRRTAQNNRGVSASSSKTTTLEVFSPATTPGGGAQGDELPLTSTTDVNTFSRQGLECQTVDENEHTSLFRTGGLNTSPAQDQEAPGTNRTGNRSHQNGGLYMQKYRTDDTPYYYSPLPQGHHGVPNDDGVMARHGNPPDVCPTTSTDNNRGTLTRRQQHNQNNQQQQPIATTGESHHEFTPLQAHPANFHSPHAAPTLKHTPHRSHSEEKHHSHHSNYHHRSSLRKVEGQQSPSQHHQQQLDHFNTFVQTHRDTVASMPEGAGSYATLGPRRHHHPPQSSVQFSTLQRPSASRSQMGMGQRGNHRAQEPQQGPDGAAQEDSGSSGYGGSPRQEGGVPGIANGSSSGGGGSRPAVVSPPPPPQAASGTLGRRRSPNDPNKSSKGGGGSVVGVREPAGEPMSK